METAFKIWRSSLVLALLICSFKSGAQTCCSGGVPISSNLGLPPEDAGWLQASLRYDLNLLNTLKSGAKTLEDDSRSRKTHSVLFQMGYSFTSRLSVDALFSWVRQERVIQQFGQTDFTQTNGLGDAVLLFKYRLWNAKKNASSFSAGLGIKAPTGAADLRNDDGLAIIADLQPGTGAWDKVMWAQGVIQFADRPGMNLSMTSVWSIKGVNEDYLDTQQYRFGKEWQGLLSWSDRHRLGTKNIDLVLVGRFRTVQEDKVNGQILPNTGGKWLFVQPGLSYWYRPDIFLSAYAEWPVYGQVQGTQTAPSFRFNAGVFYRLSLKKQEELLPLF
ncbi:MAG TPA: transporter [Saprospiraceae bacterium]|nr:transporter [Saprospiraceae bacterium]HMQ84721.1 transporter [Saprospiraceae bacterium]